MVYPNPQIYHHLKAIFVHVPKTGGTSIERTLRERPNDVVGGHSTALGYRQKFPDEFRSYFKFAVVRHPVTRFLSACRYLREMPPIPALNNASLHESDNFESWMNRVRKDPRVLEGIIHLQPQHRFLCDREGQILVDRLFHFESLDTAWVEICDLVGLPWKPLPRLNPSKIIAGQNIELTTDQIDWVSEIYEEDFRLGNYQSENSPADLKHDCLR